MSVRIPETPLRIPDILLPNKSINLNAWSIIACDQFTSDPSYWQKAQDIVQNDPSTLHLVLPEYLLSMYNEKDLQNHFTVIENTTQHYLKNNIFATYENTILLVKRYLHKGLLRNGILMQIDLSAYSDIPTDDVAIKASEAIVENRLPRRIQARKSTVLDTPHIIMFYFEKDPFLFKTLDDIVSEKIYETPLMLDGGVVSGHICNTEKGYSILQQFFRTQPSHPLLVVGDGNHALMSAKKIWQERGERHDDPERWALVELVNIYDQGISIEPIHRVVFDVDTKNLLRTLQKYGSLESTTLHTEQVMQQIRLLKDTQLYVVDAEHSYVWSIHNAEHKNKLAIETLETVLKETSKLYTHIDFIHSPDAVLSLAKQPLEKQGQYSSNALGFILPQITQDHIFSVVHTQKLFPRKAFSIGEEIDKRYYLESCLRTLP